MFNKLPNNDKIINLIEKTIIEEPPVNMNKGNFIKKGLSNKLDKLRSISEDANKWILKRKQK